MFGATAPAQRASIESACFLPSALGSVGGAAGPAGNDGSEDVWKAVKASLVAASPDDSKREEQMVKGAQRIEGFPKCSDASHLDEFLRNVAKRIRRVATAPELMGRWIRECTDTAEVSGAASYVRWFDLMHISGAGFERIDIILLEDVRKSLQGSGHLLASIEPKEQEFLRHGRDFKGRQAILMARHYYKASRSDRKKLDEERRR